ncbi:MAG: hypothetical protein INR71_15885 [Terriglobus roseus]|nr:hypothetical protein [Terriglobus roseus]
MALPHAPPIPTFSAQTSDVRSSGGNLDYDPTLDTDRSSNGPRPEGRSSQTLERVRDTLASGLASVNLGVATASSRSASQSRPTPASENVQTATRPDPHREETDPDALARYVAAARPPSADAITAPTDIARDGMDPLGVLSSTNSGADGDVPSIVASRARQHTPRGHVEKEKAPAGNSTVTGTTGMESGSGPGSTRRQDFATFASQNAFQDR